MEKTAIIGVAQTKQVRNNLKQNFAEMVYEATQLALGDAGLDIKDIDKEGKFFERGASESPLLRRRV